MHRAFYQYHPCWHVQCVYLLHVTLMIGIFHYLKNRLLDSLVVECWHRVRQVQGSIPSKGPRHTKKVIKMVPGIGNPSKSVVIDRCGEDETTE